MTTKRQELAQSAITMMIDSLDARIKRLQQAKANLARIQEQLATANEREDKSDT